jgi:hypothetical protein
LFEVTEISFDTPDLTNSVANEDRHGEVIVWEGKGYDITGTSGNALWIKTEGGSFDPLGQASAEELARTQIYSQGHYEMEFEYDGTSTVGLIFGTDCNSWPFPVFSYDNIIVVPEISSALLVVIALGGGFILRHRKYVK